MDKASQCVYVRVLVYGCGCVDGDIYKDGYGEPDRKRKESIFEWGREPM